MKFTVFTPAYNRAETLPRLYTSLKEQTFHDFEWLVIDDGSTDGTENLFSLWLKEENFFPIIYLKTENGGKHRAINRGVSKAKGELFFIVDSDDYLPCDSLKILTSEEASIPAERKKEFAGVCGLKCKKNGTPIGKTFSGKTLDITYIEKNKHGITGDKAEVFYTEILKKYPFPEFPGENFIPESTVWNLMGGDGLKTRYFNKNVYFCEYREDGLTANSGNRYDKYPRAYGLLISQNIKYGLLNKMYKWNTLYDYFNCLKGSHSTAEIASYLGLNPVKLYLRMNGIRLFFKIYK